MKVHITIDTLDADDPGAVDTPFTLNVFTDNEDDSLHNEPLQISSENALIGDDIAEMLSDLAQTWEHRLVLDTEDMPLPRTAGDWRERSVPAEKRCNECGVEATNFWSALKTPVQLCNSCTHDAHRSGWEPGR